MEQKAARSTQSSPNAGDREMPRRGALQQLLNTAVIFPARAAFGSSKGKNRSVRPGQSSWGTMVSELLPGEPRKACCRGAADFDSNFILLWLLNYWLLLNAVIIKHTQL